MAAGWEGVADLMAEVGGTLGAAETTELPDSGAWHVRTAAGAELTVTYDPAGDRLLFRSLLGRPEPSLREATYATLLAYNGRAKETGGGWVGLEAPGGETVLRYAAPAEALDADALRGLVLGLLRVAGGLREYVGRGPQAADGGAPGRAPADLDLLRYHAIRG